jgi:hypothetical protein
MLRYIFAIIFLAVLLKITQQNAYVSFGILMFLILTFMIYTIDTIDQEDTQQKRDMLKTIAGRMRYYSIINSQ